ncbi:MAG: metal ABC transporter solute-binding protein, Zn/Mn family [Syntrophothermus sp.]
MRAPRRHPLSVLLASVGLGLLAGALLAGCGQGPGAGAAGGPLRVVAAEDFWGSIAQQLGGDRVQVTSIVTNPAADPHDYEPTSEDAKTMALAQVSIVNGLGYDEWASRLLAASPDEGRVDLNVGDVVGLEAGDNPHQWYSPRSVHAAIGAIAAAYERALPRQAPYFERRRKAFEREGLAEYRRLIAGIRARYAGTRVGASESIFEPLAEALGLRLTTPAGFMDAISEGTEPPPSERAAVEAQLRERRVDLWVHNAQNATPDVDRLDEAAEAAGIPVATVTETTTPEGARFQDWMVQELRGIEAALAGAKGG